MDKSNLTIEELKEQIVNQEIKQYFEEVYSCYSMGNYRTAINALYNVFLSDLFFKLQELVHLGDEKAKSKYEKLLQIIKDSNSKSSWEKELLDLVVYTNKGKSDYKLFSQYDEIWVSYLQNVRNMCSHPSVMDSTVRLKSPNREEVQGLIKNVLISCLTSPALYLNDITQLILNDLTTLKTLPQVDAEKYMSEKYLKHLSLVKYKKIVQFLWKTVTSDNSQDAKSNLKEVFFAYKLMTDNKKLFVNLLDNKDYLTIFSVGKTESLGRDEYLIMMLSERMWNIIPDREKAQFKAIINKNYMNKIIAYLNGRLIPLKEYKNALAKLTQSDVVRLKELFKKRFIKFDLSFRDSVDVYSSSLNYQNADVLYDMLFPWVPSNLTDEDYIYMIRKSSENRQCYGRAKAKVDHRVILVNAYHEMEDYTKIPKVYLDNFYPNFQIIFDNIDDYAGDYIPF